MTDSFMPAISADTIKLVEHAEKDCAGIFERIERIELVNTQKVLEAFQNNRVAQRHFAPSTGYGYDDIGRDTLSRIFAQVLGTEAALVRSQIVSGTHALALCLYGILRPGDIMLSAAGKPYDTMEEVIGLSGSGQGSLKEFGIEYLQTELKEDGSIDVDGIISMLEPRVKLVLLQRSRGYDWRKALSVDEINSTIDAIHEVRPDICVMVDNCYGEFTDIIEPRADIMAGSLIKNPGGGLAHTGGYVAGKSEYVEKVSFRLTSPGIGAEVGSYAAGYQVFYQGFFMAPHIVAQAVKTAVLAARTFELAGYEVSPGYDAPRNDIIQAIKFGAAKPLIKFCQAIQRCSPVDSEAVPTPWDMPGYRHQVIMAAGTFIGGASIELSADAPITPPYTAYMQGALTYAHGRLAVAGALQEAGLSK